MDAPAAQHKCCASFCSLRFATVKGRLIRTASSDWYCFRELWDWSALLAAGLVLCRAPVSANGLGIELLRLQRVIFPRQKL